MKSKHSFYIPDRELLLDLPGLLSHLGEKVVLANLCLYCPNGGREFSDLSAVRKHMIDKSHCKMAYETDEDRAEVADFYDFRGGSEDGSDWEELDDEEGLDQEDVVEVRSRLKRIISVHRLQSGLGNQLGSGWFVPCVAVWAHTRPSIFEDVLRPTISSVQRHRYTG